MPSLRIIGLPSYDLHTVTLGVSEVPTLPAANLNTWPLWQPCRINSIDPSKTWIRCVLTESDPLGLRAPTGLPQIPRDNGFPVSGVALPGHNLGPQSTWRMRLLEAGASPGTPERLAPTSVSLTSMTGVVGSIDEDPYSVDGNYIENDGSDNAGVVLAPVANPAVPPSGPCYGRVQFEFDDIEMATPETVLVEVWDGVTSIASLLWSNDSSGSAGPVAPSGTVYVVPFDASLLLTPDGSALQIRLTVIFPGTPAAGLFRVGAMDIVTGTPDTGILYTSPTMLAVPDDRSPVWGSSRPSSVGVGARQSMAWATTDIVDEVYEVEVQLFPQNMADPYVDIGRLIAAPAFIPATGRDWGELIRPKSLDKITPSKAAGARWIVARGTERAMSIPLNWLTNAEMYALYDRGVRAGSRTPFVVSAVPDGDLEQYHTTMYCQFTRLPNVGSADKTHLKSTSFEVVETAG